MKKTVKFLSFILLMLSMITMMFMTASADSLSVSTRTNFPDDNNNIRMTVTLSESLSGWSYAVFRNTENSYEGSSKIWTSSVKTTATNQASYCIEGSSFDTATPVYYYYVEVYYKSQTYKSDMESVTNPCFTETVTITGYVSGADGGVKLDIHNSADLPMWAALAYYNKENSTEGAANGACVTGYIGADASITIPGSIWDTVTPVYYFYVHVGYGNGFNSNIIAIKNPKIYTVYPDGINYINGVGFYYKENTFQKDYTGLVMSTGTTYAMYYVENGILNTKYTGLAQYSAGLWYYVVNGVADLGGYSGLVEYNGAWFYVEGGMLDWYYTGLTLYNDSWFYVSEGVLDWGYTGLTLYNGSWYYVNGGVLDWGYTGLTPYNGSWYYVSGGVLDWGYTGLTLYDGSWYYVNGGVLDWGYTGLTFYDGSWYYVNGGVLDWNYTGLTPYGDAWFYVENGVLNWGYAGLVCYNDAWYYVNGGVLDWGYTGLAYYNGSWFYVSGGVLNWGYSGKIFWNGNIYTIVNGKAAV